MFTFILQVISYLIILSFFSDVYAQFGVRYYYGFSSTKKSSYIYTPGSYSSYNNYLTIMSSVAKIKSSAPNSTKKPLDKWLYFERYEYNFTTYDSTLTVDSILTSVRVKFLGDMKYGSQYKHRLTIRQYNIDNSIEYKTSDLLTETVRDVGCLYDSRSFPLADSENNILYPLE